MKKLIKFTHKYKTLEEIECSLDALHTQHTLIIAYATHSKSGSEEPDSVVSIFETEFIEGETLPKGARYVWVTEAEFKRLTSINSCC